MPSKLKVVPVRRTMDTYGPWILTQAHRAQAWAIAAFVSGEHMRILLRFSTKAKAEDNLLAAQRAAEGPIKRNSLGKRMSKCEKRT